MVESRYKQEALIKDLGPPCVYTKVIAPESPGARTWLRA